MEIEASVATLARAACPPLTDQGELEARVDSKVAPKRGIHRAGPSGPAPGRGSTGQVVPPCSGRRGPTGLGSFPLTTSHTELPEALSRRVCHETYAHAVELRLPGVTRVGACWSPRKMIGQALPNNPRGNRKKPVRLDAVTKNDAVVCRIGAEWAQRRTTGRIDEPDPMRLAVAPLRAGWAARLDSNHAFAAHTSLIPTAPVEVTKQQQRHKAVQSVAV